MDATRPLTAGDRLDGEAIGHRWPVTVAEVGERWVDVSYRDLGGVVRLHRVLAHPPSLLRYRESRFDSAAAMIASLIPSPRRAEEALQPLR